MLTLCLPVQSLGTFTTLAALALSPGLSFAEKTPEGGAHGGGGDAAFDRPLKREELQTLASKLPQYLVWVLNYQELLAHRDEKLQDLTKMVVIPKPEGEAEGDVNHLRNAQERMFPKAGARDVFQELKTAKFVLRDSGGCKDLKFTDKDATAFNSDQNEICLSADRLLEKLHYSNAVTELIAIAVHELTHRMGGEEDEAVALQSLVRHTLRSGVPEEYESRMSALHFASRPIYRADGGIFADILKSSSSNTFAACLHLSKAVVSLRFLWITSKLEVGSSLLTAQQLSHVQESHKELTRLSDECDAVAKTNGKLRNLRRDVQKAKEHLEAARASARPK